MKKQMTFHDVEARLRQYTPNKMEAKNYSLDRIRSFLATLGNPQDRLRVIHVAGTSGKTSTAYYIRALLERAGARTGLTVSPHIDSLGERVQLDGSPMGEVQFTSYFQQFYPYVEAFMGRLTQFEILTAFYYWVCEKEQVDYAVVETGLGGRLDATNVVDRPDKVCVITDIGLDHTEILGSTLERIASEKAGVILPRSVVFTTPQVPAVQQVFEVVSAKLQAQIRVVTPKVAYDVEAPLFQQKNFQLAYQVVVYIAARDGWSLPADAKQLVTTVRIPGRFEIYEVGDKTIVLDGAHNPQKLTTLFTELQRRNFQSAALVVSLSEAPTQKIIQCINQITDFSEQCIYTTFGIQRDVVRRSVPFEELPGGSPDGSVNMVYVEDAQQALRRAVASANKYIVVTGSLYLVCVLRPFITSLAKG